MKACFPSKARSELTKPKSPGFAGLEKPAGFGVFLSSSMPLAAVPASKRPGDSAARGSDVDCAAATDVTSAAAMSTATETSLRRGREPAARCCIVPPLDPRANRDLTTLISAYGQGQLSTGVPRRRCARRRVRRRTTTSPQASGRRDGPEHRPTRRARRADADADTGAARRARDHRSHRRRRRVRPGDDPPPRAGAPDDGARAGAELLLRHRVAGATDRPLARARDRADAEVAEGSR